MFKRFYLSGWKVSQVGFKHVHCLVVGSLDIVVIQRME